MNFNKKFRFDSICNINIPYGPWTKIDHLCGVGIARLPRFFFFDFVIFENTPRSPPLAVFSPRLTFGDSPVEIPRIFQALFEGKRTPVKPLFGRFSKCQSRRHIKCLAIYDVVLTVIGMSSFRCAKCRYLTFGSLWTFDPNVLIFSD